MAALVSVIERAFASVGENLPGPEFYGRVLYAETFDGDGLYLGYMDSEGRPWAWIGVYHGESGTLPLHRFAGFLGKLGAHPQVDELHVSTTQSPNAAATGRILERFGFQRVGSNHYAARTPQWERHHAHQSKTDRAR